MSQVVTELLAAALKLSPEEREALAERLWDSLGPPDTGIDAMSEAELEVELNRRREEARRDPSVMVPWEEVKRKLLAGE